MGWLSAARTAELGKVTHREPTEAQESDVCAEIFKISNFFIYYVGGDHDVSHAARKETLKRQMHMEKTMDCWEKTQLG